MRIVAAEARGDPVARARIGHRVVMIVTEIFTKREPLNASMSATKNIRAVA
jgi:hypothetical protein